jgi:uncharacterized protein (TIGR02594 family)
MQSNLERLTSMLLVASAVVVVGTSSPALARRHLPERTFVSEAGPWSDMGGTQRWTDASAHDASRRAEYVRSNRRGHHRDEYRQDSARDNGWSANERDGTWGQERVGLPGNERAGRRRTRVASLGNKAFGASQGSGSDVVSEARHWIGTNPTGWASVWCGRFMNFVLERTGRRGTGSNLARSFANYGSRVGGPQVGAIAVMGRSGRAAGGSAGGHVGVVSGIDPNGNPIIISGNHGHTVAEAVYPRNRIFAYVMP